MSLLIDTLKTLCDGNKQELDSSILPNLSKDPGSGEPLPFINEIINKQFDVTSKSIQELEDSLLTFNYLMQNSEKVVEELIWMVGISPELVDRYFDCIDPINYFNFLLY